MPKVLSEPTVIEIEGVYLDQAQTRFRQALSETPEEHSAQAKELCYLVYESLARGKFGSGRFDVAITCNEEEFVIGVRRS